MSSGRFFTSWVTVAVIGLAAGALLGLTEKAAAAQLAKGECTCTNSGLGDYDCQGSASCVAGGSVCTITCQ
jgi:hypothetical protein